MIASRGLDRDAGEDLERRRIYVRTSKPRWVVVPG
jgi:hypothetical protein